MNVYFTHRLAELQYYISLAVGYPCPMYGMLTKRPTFYIVFIYVVLGLYLSTVLFLFSVAIAHARPLRYLNVLHLPSALREQVPGHASDCEQ